MNKQVVESVGFGGDVVESPLAAAAGERGGVLASAPAIGAAAPTRLFGLSRLGCLLFGCNGDGNDDESVDCLGAKAAAGQSASSADDWSGDDAESDGDEGANSGVNAA